MSPARTCHGLALRLRGLGARFLPGNDREPWLTVFAMLCVAAPWYLFAAVKYPYPIGFGGLYALMASEILENHFSLPLHISYYGPGGLPFAYPPLASYVMAGAMAVTHISAMDYMRFAPPVFTLLSLVPTYFLFRKIAKSDTASVLAICLVGLSPVLFDYDVSAGGTVRGLAQLLTMGCLCCLFTWMEDRRSRSLVLTGVLLALTILTHLTNALFLAVALPTVCAFHMDARNAVRACGKIFFLGALVSAPWWIHLLLSFGPSLFTGALHSHSNMDALRRLQDPLDIPRMVKDLTYMFADTPILYYLVGMGAGLAILTRRWFLPTWFLLSLLGVSEGWRLTIFIGALLAGQFGEAALRSVTTRRIPAILTIGILLLYNNAVPAHKISASAPVLSQETMDFAAWFRDNTPNDATFISLAAREDYSEWMPYLLRRTPLVGHWGAEWRGDFYAQQRIVWASMDCYNRAKWACVKSLLAEHQYNPDYIILSLDGVQDALVHDMQIDKNLLLVYHNSQAYVFRTANP